MAIEEKFASLKPLPLDFQIMTWMRLNQCMRWGAIASLVLFTSVACPSPNAVVAPTDDSDEAAAPSSETAADSEAEPEASTAESIDVDPTTETETAAPPPIAVAEKSCSASAYVVDTDPAGLNVRSGPSSEFAVIDTLPTDGPVEVSIVGATNGWFLLNEAYSTNQQELEQPGWVYAPLLGVTTTSLDINNPAAPAKLYESPDGYSNVKNEVPQSTEVTLLSCSGDWLRVQAGAMEGWLAIGDQCSSPGGVCP